MRLLRTARAVIVAITLSPFANAQHATLVAENGRRVMAERDVPSNSALFGVTVTSAPEGRSTIVTAVSAHGSPLHVGDQIDEVQLPGVVEREHQANPGYWSYQVWTPADFSRLAAECLNGCLVRLRTAEQTKWPRVFAYLPIGNDAVFKAARDDAGRVLAYVDVLTGERFGPPASAVFGR